MAAGLAGAGFCLVLAMVVLVVALGGGASTRPPPRATRTSTSPSELSGRGHRYRTTIVYEPRPVAGNGSASAVRYGLGLLVAQFRGAGSVRGDTFRITRPGDWGISWQFRCTKGRPGNLTIDADDSAAGGGHGEGLGRILGKGNGKEPPGQAKKHKKHKKHEKKKHKKKVPPGQGKKAIRSKNHSKQARGTGGQPGNGDGGGDQNSRVTLIASGYDGRGMSWYTSDPGDHTLEVISSCTWAIKVVLPKP